MPNLSASDTTFSNLPDADFTANTQASVDRLIAHVNEQIELLALDSPDPTLLRQMIQALSDERTSSRLSLIEALSEIGEPAT